MFVTDITNRKFNLKLLKMLHLLFVVFSLYGCSDNSVKSIEGVQTIEYFPLTTTVKAVTPFVLETGTPTPVSQGVIRLTNTFATATPQVQALSTPFFDLVRNNSKNCHFVPLDFEMVTQTGVMDFVYFHFINESRIAFGGWVVRNEFLDEILPVTNSGHLIQPTQATPSAHSQGDNNFRIPSARILFKTGYIDIQTGTVEWEEPSLTLLNNPCSGICSLQIISESDNHQWQLIQIADTNQEVDGIWLVNKQQTKKLVEYVPSSSRWMWSNDGTVLWFVHSIYEYGQRAILIHLDQLSSIEMVEDKLLDATYYDVAFSPIDKTVIAIPKFRDLGQPDRDNFIWFDLKLSSSLALEEKLTGLEIIVWDNASNSFVPILINQNGLLLFNLSAEFQIHFSEFFKVFPDSQAQDVSLAQVLPRDNYTISPQGNFVAIASWQLLLFKCNMED